MPRVNISIQTAGGQTIVLTEGDKIVKEVVIECSSQRCASRHGQDKPQEVALIDGQPMPEEGIQWMSLILPETSPQYTPMPPNFCSPTCVRDFLVYQYLAPPVRKTDLPAIADVEASIGSHDLPAPEEVLKHVDWPEWTKADSFGETSDLPEPTVLAQADGAGDPGDEHN